MPESMMKSLRDFRGLDENDQSEDFAILSDSPREIFENLCEWEGMGLGSGYQIISWIEEIWGVSLD